MLSDDFQDYARLSAQLKLRLEHKGIIVLQEQVGEPDDVGFIPRDSTVGLVDPVIDYPTDTENRDNPGKMGGPPLDHDNSLSYFGGPNTQSAPMALVFAVPAHTLGAAAVSEVTYNNLRNEDLGADMEVELLLSTKLGVLDEDLVTFEYWDGAVYVALEGEERFDGIAYKFDLTLPSAAHTGMVRWRTTLDASMDEGDYHFNVVGRRVLGALASNPPGGAFYEGEVLNDFTPARRLRKLFDEGTLFDAAP